MYNQLMICKLEKYGLAVNIPKSAPPFIAQMVKSGEWEAEECQIILQAINKKHRVLEGGSLLGVTTVLLDRQASFVISYEANPAMAELAQKNQKQNRSSAKIINAALSSQDGQAIFELSDNIWDSKVTDAKSQHSKKVKRVDARRIVKENNINALVLDVEGEEEKILMTLDLSPIDVILVELHEHINKARVIRKIKRSGFKIKNRDDKTTHSIVWAERDPRLSSRILAKLSF